MSKGHWINRTNVNPIKKIAMKKMYFLGLLLLLGFGCHAQIPILDIVTEAAEKVVMAIDLQVQELENETLVLQEAQKEIENELVGSEMTDIAGWLEDQKDLYAGYYQELWEVKTAISGFERVAQMMQEEGQSVAQVKQLNGAMGQDKHLTAAEATVMGNQLANIVKAAAQDIGRLELAVQALVTQMGDADRLRIIDEAGDGIDQHYADVQVLSQRSAILSLNRAQDANDVAVTRALYGL
jgi:hypothetical protein